MPASPSAADSPKKGPEYYNILREEYGKFSSGDEAIAVTSDMEAINMRTIYMLATDKTRKLIGASKDLMEESLMSFDIGAGLPCTVYSCTSPRTIWGSSSHRHQWLWSHSDNDQEEICRGPQCANLWKTKNLRRGRRLPSPLLAMRFRGPSLEIVSRRQKPTSWPQPSVNAETMEKEVTTEASNGLGE